MKVTVRYADVQVTHFAGDPSPPPLFTPQQTVTLDSGEHIIGVTEYYTTSGALGSYITVHARVWIATEAT